MMSQVRKDLAEANEKPDAEVLRALCQGDRASCAKEMKVSKQRAAATQRSQHTIGSIES
jgi:hypothetical protein